MNNIKKKIPAYKIVLAVSGVACLAVVVVFSIIMSGKFRNKISEDYPEQTFKFVFDSSTLKYDGTSSLDFLEGVKVVDENGDTFTGRISASVKSADQSGRYIINYSVVEPNGAIAKAVRILEVSNYQKPSISFDKYKDEILSSQIKNAVALLIEKNHLSASDGFGHDISNAISMNIDSVLTDSGRYTVTFTVENILGDTASLHSEINITLDHSEMMILLSDDSVTLEKNAYFDPYAYIASASDPSDGDVTKSVVVVSNNVNTSKEGTYKVAYSFTNRAGNICPEVTLTVKVK